MDILNETSVLIVKCRNGTISESGGNITDMGVNLTECLSITESDGLQASEMLTVAMTTGLGIIGIVFNIAVLAVTFHKKLNKKDYRMVYYMFITTGDLLFAINSLFVGINIAFKSLYFLKLFGVCLTLMLIFGVIAYQWSAICIILLLVDLVTSIRDPFKDNKRMKTFSKIGCVWTFFIGIILAVGPFLYWQDNPVLLPFCSIGNLYGKNLAVYHIMAVSVLSTLVTIMILVSGILLFEIYRSHNITSGSGDDYRGSVAHVGPGDDENKPCDGGTPGERRDSECYVISVDIKATDITANGECHGEVNGAFVGNLGEIVEDLKKSKSKRLAREYKGAKKDNQVEDSVIHASARDLRRREFIRACRTVGFFMAAYLGCCGPYLIWSALGIACGTDCSTDRPETRDIRALVAVALYLLPIIDPILYTRRFNIFKSEFGMMKRCCCKKGGHRSEVTTF